MATMAATAIAPNPATTFSPWDETVGAAEEEEGAAEELGFRK